MPVNASSHHDALSQCTATLSSALQVLDSFNRRNKNQHRVASWWTQFGLLRRCARKLDDTLAVYLLSLQVRNLKRAKQSQPQVLSRNGKALDHDLTSQARKFVESTIPLSFLAFTQLAADNQHAALGLVLLGVLASINSVVTRLLPPDPQDEQLSRDIEAPKLPHPKIVDKTAQIDPRGFGEIISRDQLSLSVKTRPQSTLPPPPSPPSPPEHAQEPEIRIAAKKRKPTVTTTGTASAKRSMEQRPHKSQTKKTKKSDPFSDIFSSLI
ncbi:Ribonuclease MRP protein subunit rmp1 [Colletotrichum sidae]|uniref:Ribonuclease MRP protein subunit rmp1 n=1 Tax=Colletotrichum sidae TaxID=1347389 RepID=A0A4R8T1B8_9PEZI|nr:Ribonuclease MRP protein subunit rmp1 [Colletotrichum sidae]